MKEKVLFISNKLFLDDSKPEGGVRLCTYDFIQLLQTQFEVITFSLSFNRRLNFRIKARAGLDVFEDYHAADYADELEVAISTNRVRFAFINLTGASDVSTFIKQKFKETIKIILCSHGNESGDFLHQSIRFNNFMTVLQRKTSALRLGKVLQKELWYRLHNFDLILTVSDIESATEKWLGAKQVFFVPRVFRPGFLDWHPIAGRLGFIGDVSHYPNYWGLKEFCAGIKKNPACRDIEVRIIGKECARLAELSGEFPFVTALGYMDNAAAEKEAAAWTYFLNPVFYYSKGLSTKLAKGMNWGLPVLSTTAGNRGYEFGGRTIPTFDAPAEMANAACEFAPDPARAAKDRNNVLEIVNTFKDFSVVMKDLMPVLENL